MVSCDPACGTKNDHFAQRSVETPRVGQKMINLKKRDTGKRPTALARNASWPDNPRSAARRAAQDLVIKNTKQQKIKMTKEQHKN